jgi:uncharacterized membrane protein
MPDTGEKPRRRRRATTAARKTRETAGGAADEATGTVQDTAETTADAAGDTAGEATDAASAGGSDKTTFTGELIDAVRSAAIDVLRPVAKEATSTAAKFAVARGPEVVKNQVLPKVADAGGAGALAKGAAGGVSGLVGGVADKVGGKGGAKKPTGHGRGRRLPVQEYIDVGVDIETVYDQWTQFEELPRFMHRVEKIEQRDDTTLMWHENIWGVRRSWEAEITEQRPCERIAWKSKGGPQVVGVVTFHKLADNLTRVQVNMDFQPKGLFEKTASGFRMSRRALASDLMRFKAFIEMRDDATGAWRGEIEEGELVEGQDQDQDQDEQARFSKEDEGPEGDADADADAEEYEDADADEDLEDEDAEEEEIVAEGDDDEAFEDSDEEEEEPEPTPRRRTRKRATTKG